MAAPKYLSEPTTIDDIIAALAAAGLGQTQSDTQDWRLRGGYLQAAPDRSICVYEAGGRPPETADNDEYPTIQIRVRGAPDDYQVMAQMERAIYRFLHAGNAPVQIGTAYVYCYSLQSGPIPMGQDENRRPAVTRNYRVMKSRPAT